MNKKQLIVAWVVVIFLLSGCATVYNPATGKRDEVFALITPELEKVLGNYYYTEVYKSYSGDLYKDARLTAIGKRVTAVSDRRQDFNYRFFVVNDPTPNAFTASGGYIYVTSGLIEMSSSDDEIACVIAHELGHDASRHMAKRLPALIGFTIFMRVTSKKADYSDIQRIVNIMFRIVASGYSRQDEREADKLAVRYAKKANYNPEAFITFFSKLQSKSPQIYIPFTATHPPIPERIKNVRREILSLN